MEIYGVMVDTSRGFSVFFRKKELAHFDTYQEAVEYAAKVRGRYIQYWAKKA